MNTVMKMRPQPITSGLSTVIDIPLDRPLTAALVQDRSFNGNHGTVGSANTFDYPGLTFDDSANAKITPATADVGDPQTFSCWVKPDNIADLDVLFGLEGLSDNIVVNAGTLGAANLANAETAYVNGLAGTTVVAGVWQMCTITLDGAESASSLKIGTATTAKYDGVMAGIFISNKELSPAEIKGLYERTKRYYGRSA